MSGDVAWNESLYGCCDDWGICCFGYFCTPCLFGSNAEKIDNSNSCGMCCLYLLAANVSLCFIPHYMKRQKLRKKFNLKEEPCGDCPTTLFCSPCALCQEARELKKRASPQSVVYNAGGGSGNPPIVSQPGSNPKSDNDERA